LTLFGKVEWLLRWSLLRIFWALVTRVINKDSEKQVTWV